MSPHRLPAPWARPGQVQFVRLVPRPAPREQGDVTGVALFTYVATYQARVIVDNILGNPRTAHYDGIPHVIFPDPEIAAVGLAAARARDRGLTVAVVEIDLADAIARPWTYGRDPRRTLGIITD